MRPRVGRWDPVGLRGQRGPADKDPLRSGSPLSLMGAQAGGELPPEARGAGSQHWVCRSPRRTDGQPCHTDQLSRTWR